MPDFRSNFGQLLFATTLLRCKREDDAVELGTAFIFDYELDSETDVPLLVTCKHVVEGSLETEFFFTAQKPAEGSAPRQLDLGQRATIKIGKYEDIWFGHPDKDVDVAVSPLGHVINGFQAQGVDLYWNSLASALCPRKEHMAMIDFREPIVFVGYPYGLLDEANLLPLIRSGWTASHVDLCYNRLPGFYVDAHFHPGSSGSPVMLIDNMFATDDKTGLSRMFPRHFLLGIAKRTDKAPAGDFEGHEIGLGFVVTSDMILETAELFCQKYPPKKK